MFATLNPLRRFSWNHSPRLLYREQTIEINREWEEDLERSNTKISENTSSEKRDKATIIWTLFSLTYSKCFNLLLSLSLRLREIFVNAEKQKKKKITKRVHWKKSSFVVFIRFSQNGFKSCLEYLICELTSVSLQSSNIQHRQSVIQSINNSKKKRLRTDPISHVLVHNFHPSAARFAVFILSHHQRVSQIMVGI